jgi:hypothetical protein
MFAQSQVSSESTTIVGEMQVMFSVIIKEDTLYYGKLPKAFRICLIIKKLCSAYRLSTN